MYRVEDKYLCMEGDMLVLQSKLSTVLRADDNQTGPDGYCVTSVYFDDIWDSSLHDAQEGHRIREKYRIRIYGHRYSSIKLEVKYKRDNRIKKISREISLHQMRRLLKEKCIEDGDPSLDNPVTLFNLAISEKKLSPKIIVEYDRKAFVYEPGNVRITLDRNIRGSMDIDAFAECRAPQFQYLQEENQVLEIKYDEFLPGFIAGILESGNMNQVSFSKYKLCRMNADGLRFVQSHFG